MRASAASNSASLTRNAKCRGLKSVESEKSRVTPFAALTGTKWPHSGPASRSRISARNLAETHLSFAGMIVWLSSTLMWSSLHDLSFYHVLGLGEEIRLYSEAELTCRAPVDWRGRTWVAA